MAANLARAGFELTVWNRTASTAEQFAAANEGVSVAGTPAEAAGRPTSCSRWSSTATRSARCCWVTRARPPPRTQAPSGTLFVDCSTIGPAATREIGEALDERGLSLVDAPVTGSSPKAEDGTLTFMVGATEEEFERVAPELEAMGELIVHAGPRGHGQMIKLLNNAMAAANAAIVGEALVVGSRAGVDLEALVEVVGSGAGGSTMLDLKAGPMRNHDYTTLFKLEHMLKDVRLCLEEGQRLGVPFPSAAYAREILNAGMGMGHADDDFAAMIEPLEGAAGERL